MLLGNGIKRGLATATLASAVFLLPLGAQSASANEATMSTPAWAHHDGRSDHGRFCRDHGDHNELWLKCRKHHRH